MSMKIEDSLCWDHDRGLSREEKQELMDSHNYLRTQLGQGEVMNHPNAANLLVLDWNDQLEDVAQTYSETCSDKMKDETQLRQSFGLVYILMDRNDNNETLDKLVETWFRGHKNHQFHEGCKDSDWKCYRFRQMASQSTHLIGCGQNLCPNKTRHLVCIYSRAQMKNSLLYIPGRGCSQCPPGHSHCIDNALCSSKRYCEQTKLCGERRKKRLQPALEIFKNATLTNEPTFCSSYRELCDQTGMKTICPQTCSSPKQSEDCQDWAGAKYCLSLAPQCSNHKYGSWMQRNCCATCKVASSCLNLYDNVLPGLCNRRIRRDHCRLNFQWMFTFCKKSCGLCYYLL